MSRYIEYELLMAELEREVELSDDWKTAHEIANVAKYAPTIEIIRCGECKWGSDKQTGEAVYCEWHGFPWNVNGFCSYGERKNDERYDINAE